MGIYSRFIFPRLCHLILNQPFIAQHRRDLLARAHGNILEIGFGTGLNLPCYPARVRKITTVDPNPGMHQLTQRQIRRTQIEVHHHQLSSERLPFESGSFDCVVSTFTLCSIENVDLAVSEAHRVLKASGQFLFLEHGLSPDPSVQRWQRRLNWLEMKLADGCRLDRNVRQIVTDRGFALADIDASYLPTIPRTHGYVYRGMAIK